MSPLITIAPEVTEALAAGGPLVALESTILAHGLPRGDNRLIADRIEGRVRAAGAVPATIAVLDGVVHIGLNPTQLDRLCESDDIAKLSVRDVAVAVAGHAFGELSKFAGSAFGPRTTVQFERTPEFEVQLRPNNANEPSVSDTHVVSWGTRILR